MNRYGTSDIIYSGDGALPEAFGRWCKWEDADAEIERLRDALEWFRDFYIGTVHNADHNRKAHKKIVEALGGDK
jgi:hypothetical protein